MEQGNGTPEPAVKSKKKPVVDELELARKVKRMVDTQDGLSLEQKVGAVQIVSSALIRELRIKEGERTELVSSEGLNRG